MFFVNLFDFFNNFFLKEICDKKMKKKADSFLKKVEKMEDFELLPNGKVGKYLVFD